MKSDTIRQTIRTVKPLGMTNRNMPRTQPHIVDEPLGGKTIAAALKHWQPDLSWKAARELLAARRVMLNGTTCQDEARRLNLGDVVEVADRPGAKPPQGKDICIRFLDEHIVVVEKPAGMLTERPAAERTHRHGDAPREPSLDELLPRVIGEYSGRRLRGDEGLIWVVHRLDRDASGLLVVARTPLARERLMQQFAARTPSRIYWAIVTGTSNRKPFGLTSCAIVATANEAASNPSIPKPKLRWRRPPQRQTRLSSRSLTSNRSPHVEATRCSNANWKPVAPIKSASILPSWGTPSVAT